MSRILIVISVLMFFNASKACTCIGKSKIKNEIKNSDVIVLAKVISKEIITLKDDFLPEEYHSKKAVFYVKVLKTYKGYIKSELLKIVTGVGNGDCGFQFSIDKVYLIYTTYCDTYYNGGDKVDKFLITNICSRTRLYDKKEERKIIIHTKNTPLFEE